MGLFLCAKFERGETMTVKKETKTKASAPAKEAVAPEVDVKQTLNVYQTKAGDKLSDIATRHGVSVRTLMTRNELTSFDLKGGTVLVIKE